jgi:hypothetical protein
MQLERLSLPEWESALPKRGFEPFHAPAALEVLDAHVDGDLVLLGAFKGDRPVALLPLFEQSKAVGRALVSPPPGKSVSRLGPVLMPASPKRSKHEKLNREFAELVLEELSADETATLLRMTGGTGYSDPRPYVWADYDVETLWTYRLDVGEQSPDSLLKDASKSLRREIGDARDLDVTVGREGLDGARAVFEETRKRYAEQGRTLPVSWPYVRDLVEAMLETDRARVYVARDEADRFLTGITALYSNDAAYFWQGGARTIHEGVAVNSLVHWHIVEDIAEDPPRETVDTYDLQGANTERLCRYKAKFGSELTPYYRVQSGGVKMAAAEKAYELVAR